MNGLAPIAHWLPRGALAAIFLYHGATKFHVLILAVVVFFALGGNRVNDAPGATTWTNRAQPDRDQPGSRREPPLSPI